MNWLLSVTSKSLQYVYNDFDDQDADDKNNWNKKRKVNNDEDFDYDDFNHELIFITTAA